MHSQENTQEGEKIKPQLNLWQLFILYLQLGIGALSKSSKKPNSNEEGHQSVNPIRKLIAFAGLCLAALGIVFGDIGTSPQYALKEALKTTAKTPQDIIGATSLIVWVLFFISLWYAIVLMKFIYRPHGHGEPEGGLPALWMRLRDAGKLPRWLFFLLVLGVAFMLADGVITPPITIESANEGLKVIYPWIGSFTKYMAIAILVLLFFIQRFGTQKIGYAYGPIMLIWSFALAYFGVKGIQLKPEILQAAWNPLTGIQFGISHPLFGGPLLGVVLAFTGMEALFADAGPLGSRPIQIMWFFVLLPALALNYLGEGAILLYNPKIDDPFFGLIAQVDVRLVIPMVVESTGASIVASQALITASFSLVKVLKALFVLPDIPIIGTSKKDHNQIYIPLVNFVLGTACVLIADQFGTSDSLAGAYGIAVTGTMTVTCVVIFYIALVLVQNKWIKILLCSAALLMGSLVSLFFVANFSKILQGGEVPLGIGVVLTWYMLTTYRRRTRKQREKRSLALSAITPDKLEGGLTIVFLDDLIHYGAKRAIEFAANVLNRPYILVHVLLDPTRKAPIVQHVTTLIEQEHLQNLPVCLIPTDSSVTFGGCEPGSYVNFLDSPNGALVAPVMTFLKEYREKIPGPLFLITSQTITGRERHDSEDALSGNVLRHQFEKIPNAFVIEAPWQSSNGKG